MNLSLTVRIGINFFPDPIPRSPENPPPHNVTLSSPYYKAKSPSYSSTPLSTSVTSPSRVSKLELPPVMTTRRDPLNHRNVLTNLAAMAMGPIVRQLSVKIPDAMDVVTQYERKAIPNKSAKSAKSSMSGARSTRSTRSTRSSAGKRKSAQQE